MKKVLKLKDSNLSWFSYHPSVWYLDLWDADPAVGVLIQHLQDQLLQLFTDFGPEEKTKWRFGKSLTHTFPSRLPEEEIEWLYLTWDTLNRNSMKLWLFCCLLYQAVFVNMQKIIYSFLGLAVGKNVPKNESKLLFTAGRFGHMKFKHRLGIKLPTGRHMLDKVKPAETFWPLCVTEPSFLLFVRNAHLTPPTYSKPLLERKKKKGFSIKWKKFISSPENSKWSVFVWRLFPSGSFGCCLRGWL